MMKKHKPRKKKIKELNLGVFFSMKGGKGKKPQKMSEEKNRELKKRKEKKNHKNTLIYSKSYLKFEAF